MGLPHADPTLDWSTCAYSQKIRRLGGMLRDAGHQAILYAGERSHGVYDEHVVLYGAQDRRRWFGDETWRDRVFDRWEANDPCWVETNEAAIQAIHERLEADDIIGIIAGECQRAVAEAFPGHLIVEWGVGYPGVLDRTFRAFESRAWAAHVAGRRVDDDFRAFDAVIPNSWEPEEFPELGAGDGGYALFAGRLIRRKGPHVALEAAGRLGLKLVVVGQGAAESGPGRLLCADGTLLEGDVEYLGVANADQRRQLMEHAALTFCPTQYLEPFGGVAVESMLCGTPAVCTAWGAFPETVVDGVTGYLCSTLQEFVDAGHRAPELDRQRIRDYAMGTFSTTVVGEQYAAWLARLATLRGDGWYTMAA